MIDKLNLHYSFNNPATVYDEEALTALELAGRQGAKINEIAESQNELHDTTEKKLYAQDAAIKKMNDITMPSNVKTEIQKNINDGSFDMAIQEYAGELETRLNNFFENTPQGGTTLDAEVIDIRVGENGKTYENAGAAVREQISEVNNNHYLIANKFDCGENHFNKNDVEPGYYYSTTTGEKTISKGYHCSPFIPCQPNEDWWVVTVAHITLWDKNKNFIGGFVANKAESGYFMKFNTGENCYFIVMGVATGILPVTMLSKGTSRAPYRDYINIIKNSALDKDQMKRKRVIDMLMEYKNCVTVTWNLGGLNSEGSFIESATNAVTDFFTVPSFVHEFKFSSNLQSFWCAYDENKKFLYSSGSMVTSGVIPNDAAYYRIYSQLTTAYHIPDAELMKIWYETTQEGKMPYESGYIRFTVPVSQDTTGINITPTIKNVDCVLKLPVNYHTNGRPSKLLMICHGAGRGISECPDDLYDNWTLIPSYNLIVDSFVNAGYAVFDCNGYDNTLLGYNHWGSLRGLEGYRKAYDYVTKNYNVEQNVNIYGFSMGGLTALNLAEHGLPNIKCLALGSPAIDLASCSENNSALLTSYGMGSSYNSYVALGFDPYLRLHEINGRKLCFSRYPILKIWHGDADTATPYTKSSELVTALRYAGKNASFRQLNGKEHDICYGSDEIVVREIVTWVERFNG